MAVQRHVEASSDRGDGATVTMGRKRKRQSSPSKSDIGGVSGVEMGTFIIEGEHLVVFLETLAREIELAKVSKGAVPEKIWMKQQFSVGINDTTRVLERMPRSKDVLQCSTSSGSQKESAIQLQAVILVSDCSPKWLIKHFPSLAYSRGVPLISVRDNKAGSLRLGELVKLKTAMAIGVKANGSGINKFIANVLDRRGLVR